MVSFLQSFSFGIVAILTILPSFQFMPLGPGLDAQNRYIYHLNEYLGMKVKVHCDVHMAGFLVSNVKVVWSLALRLLSRSGCNPKDPVTTLAELHYVRSHWDGNQIYKSIKAPQGWTFHAEGAVLDQVGTNAHSAWIGVTIENARLEDSGTYRCDAMVGDLDDSVRNESRSGFTELKVSAPPGYHMPEFTHVTLEESISSQDYDSSVIQPTNNHKRVGESVNVTCSARLLKNAPNYPFPVSHAALSLLSFHQSGSTFKKVASYSAKKRAIHMNAPIGKLWKLRPNKDAGKLDDIKDSSRLRIDIEIPILTLEDTGIFLCTVVKATTGSVYEGEASLKVSNDPNVVSGYCDPSQPLKGEPFSGTNDRDLFAPPGRKDGFDVADVDDLEADANIFEDYRDDMKTTEAFDNTKCIIAIAFLSVEIIVICILARVRYWHVFCCCCPTYMD